MTSSVPAIRGLLLLAIDDLEGLQRKPELRGVRMDTDTTAYDWVGTALVNTRAALAHLDDLRDTMLRMATQTATAAPDLRGGTVGGGVVVCEF